MLRKEKAKPVGSPATVNEKIAAQGIWWVVEPTLLKNIS